MNLADKKIAIIGLGYVGLPLAVSHNEFKELDLRALLTTDGVLFDVKSSLPIEIVDERL